MISITCRLLVHSLLRRASHSKCDTLHNLGYWHASLFGDGYRKARSFPPYVEVLSLGVNTVRKHEPFSRRCVNTSSSSGLFRYQSLDATASKDSPAIRLLEIVPGQTSDDLRCQLHHSTLSTAPPYETLSYRWGDTTDKESISCDSAILQIPRTLAFALRHIRRHDGSILIWADAACIDQKNLREKEQQVQLMRHIYSRAKRTLIWLGDQPDLNMSWTARVPILFSLGWFGRRAKRNEIPHMRFADYHTGDPRLVSPLSPEGYIAYVNILRNPWFARAWVVQEVAVSKDPTIIWNGCEIPWTDVVRGLEFLSRMDFGLAFIPTLQHIASIESERQRYKAGGGQLLGILQRHQRCDATDPRDKVYAFAGLTADQSHELDISYTKPSHEMYKDIAKHILISEKSLNLLSQPATIERKTVNNLPSWVPDWSHVRSVKMSHSWGLETLALAKKMPFPGDNSIISFTAAPGMTKAPSLTGDDRGLHIEAIIIDTISDVGEVFEGVELPPPTTNIRGIIKGWVYTSRTYIKAQRSLMSWEALACSRQPNETYSHTGEPILDAYWKTVSAGDYPHVEGVNIEVNIWNRVNRLAWRLRKWKAESIVLLPYSILLSVWQAVSKGPAFKFHIQGHYTLHRRLAKTSEGYLALTNADVSECDVVVLARGSNVPLILRKADNGNWKLVGDAYVHGIMFGEAWDEKAVQKLILHEIVATTQS